MAVGAGGLDIRREVRRLPLLRADTRTLVLAVMYGVGFAAVQQVTERLDVAWSGGTQFWIGFITAIGMALAAAPFLGIIGMIVMALIETLIGAFLTTSPIAWFWIVVATVSFPIFATLAYLLDAREYPLRAYALMCLFVALVFSPIVFLTVNLVLLGLPPAVGVPAILPYVFLPIPVYPVALAIYKAIEATDIF